MNQLGVITASISINAVLCNAVMSAKSTALLACINTIWLLKCNVQCLTSLASVILEFYDKTTISGHSAFQLFSTVFDSKPFSVSISVVCFRFHFPSLQKEIDTWTIIDTHYWHNLYNACRFIWMICDLIVFIVQICDTTKMNMNGLAHFELMNDNQCPTWNRFSPDTCKTCIIAFFSPFDAINIIFIVHCVKNLSNQKMIELKKLLMRAERVNAKQPLWCMQLYA